MGRCVDVFVLDESKEAMGIPLRSRRIAAWAISYTEGSVCLLRSISKFMSAELKSPKTLPRCACSSSSLLATWR